EQIRDVAVRLDQEAVHRVAIDLVAEGLLTRFQTKQLLAGNSRGFVLGRYRILDQIGQGGMGIVYKAVHTTMDRLVAIKVLNPTMSKDKDWCRHIFRRESLAAAELDHPNIVHMYDSGKSKGVYYIAMEYVRGPNLKKLVQEHGPLPVPLACEFVR